MAGVVKLQGEGWQRIVVRNGRVFVNGRESDTVMIDGVAIQVGNLPRNTEIFLRGKKRKKVWD